MDLSEKAAYLKGMIEGLGIDGETREGKVIRAMSELLMEMAAAVDDVQADVEDLNDDLDDLDEFLGQAFFGDGQDGQAQGNDNGSAEASYEVECPNCGETVYVSEADLEEKEAFCSRCGKSFGIELEEGDGEEAMQYEITCPRCGASNVLNEDELTDGEARCASCGAPLIADVDGDAEEDAEDGE